MVRLGYLVLLFTLTFTICTFELVYAGDFGIPRRAVSGSVAQSRELSAQNRTYSHSANNSQPHQPFPNIARLVAFDPNGQSFGSCSYIGSVGDYGVIVSNWHVICEADGLVHVHFPSGFSSFGAIVQFDRKWDLAVIVISKPPTAIPPLPIMQSAPRPGEPLWVAGYGAGSYRIASGYCVEYLAPEIPKNGTAPSFEIIKLSTTARQGDSGGPILNQNGELAGVLFGSDMVASTAGSHCERVKWFLQQTNPIITKLPQKPEALFASIEPTGPKHALNSNQNDAKRQNPILQAKTIPAPPAVIAPPEKAILNNINNNINNPQNPFNNSNNSTNEKEKISINNSYNKSAQNNHNQNINTPKKHVEKRPAIAKEKTNKTAEWAYNRDEKTENIYGAKKNLVVPIANFQVVEEKPKTKVAMAILHFTKDPIPKTVADENFNQNSIDKIDNSEIVMVVGSIGGLGVVSGRVDYSRRCVVAVSVVIFSFLFYCALRLLGATDNNNQTAASTGPNLIPIKTDVPKIAPNNIASCPKNDNSDQRQKKRKHNSTIKST
jgi:hypothetical protein